MLDSLVVVVLVLVSERLQRTVLRPRRWRWPRCAAVHDAAIRLRKSVRSKCPWLTHEHGIIVLNSLSYFYVYYFRHCLLLFRT